MSNKACILVSQDEYYDLLDKEKKLKEFECKYNYLKKDFDELSEKYDELKEKHPELKVTIESRVYDGSLSFPYIGYINSYIGGNSILVSINLKRKVADICDKIRKQVNEYCKEKIISNFTKQMQNKNIQYTNLRNDYDNLLDLVKKHDRKCWFNRNKILKK